MSDTICSDMHTLDYQHRVLRILNLLTTQKALSYYIDRGGKQNWFKESGMFLKPETNC